MGVGTSLQANFVTLVFNWIGWQAGCLPKIMSGVRRKAIGKLPGNMPKIRNRCEHQR